MGNYLKTTLPLGSGIAKFAAPLLLAPMLLLSACDTPGPTAEAPGAETTDPNYDALETSNVTAEELSGNAEEYIGQKVSIRGEIDSTIQDGAFLLDEDELFSDLFGGEDILVFNFGEPMVLPEDDSQVQVTGDVALFVSADVEREYGIDLDPNLYADYENRPAIFARSMALAPDPAEVSQNPTAYYNRTIAVKGEVEDLYGTQGFTLDEDELFGGEDLLVINAMTMDSLEGEEVVVTGVLRPYVQADFERDYDLQWDLSVQEQIEAEYTNKPVLVATDVYPSAK